MGFRGVQPHVNAMQQPLPGPPSPLTAATLLGNGMAIRTRIVASTLVVLLAAAGGYYLLGARGAPAPTAQKGGPPAQPPADVAVLEIKRADVPLTLAYAGRVAGFRTVE